MMTLAVRSVEARDKQLKERYNGFSSVNYARMHVPKYTPHIESRMS